MADPSFPKFSLENSNVMVEDKHGQLFGLKEEPKLHSFLEKKKKVFQILKSE